jgi:hypothetical protein
VVTDNCIKGAPGWYAGSDGAGIQNPQVGFTATDNLVVDPGYINAGAGDYRIPSDNPCSAILAGANVDPSVQPPPGAGSASNGRRASAKRTRKKKRAKMSRKAKAKARA